MEKIKYKIGVIVEEDNTEIDVIKIDKSRMGRIDGSDPRFTIDASELYISIRGDGELKERALYLSKDHDWVLCKDHLGMTCLIPLKKETE